MPLALLRYRQSVTDDVLEHLIAAIPVAIAAAFDCEDDGGDLSPKDIEVEVAPVGPKDVNAYDVCITVLANHFPSRDANHEERRLLMQAMLAEYVPKGLKAYLWTLLIPASFGEFNMRDSPRLFICPECSVKAVRIPCHTFQCANCGYVAPAEDEE